jgi:cytochrome c553
MRTTLITIAAVVAFAGTALGAGPNTRTGEAISKQCGACHGNDGMSVDNNIPNLAGQHFVYLQEQMNAYKKRTRINPIMNQMISSLSQEQIDDIAVFYASIPIRTGAASQPKK